MAWPLPSDFRRMLQSPRVAFRDPRLQLCRIEKDAMGQPRPWAGAFAVVYRATDPNTGQTLAVRVFNTQSAERRNRYDVICAYLRNRKTRCLVDFEYRDASIRSVDGKWYPVIVMDWVHGATLFEWVRAHASASNVPAIEGVARNWLAVVQELGEVRVVHGDLQHGNVLVMADGTLKLVDYDGIGVPGLIGRRNLEIGVDPYQHPGRNGATILSPNLDNFSAIVIYTALLAVAADPSLWRVHVEQSCYEKLLFRKTDFEAPDASPLFRDLRASEDAKVRDLAERLIAYRSGPPDEVPPLSEVVMSPPRIVAPASHADAEFHFPWQKVSAGPVPAFCPLCERGGPIIALANLKGGVGRTTLAANLGAVLAQEKRVLLVDLDYQGSLTSLCLPPQQIEEIRRRGGFVDRILQTPAVDLDEFQRCCHAVPDRPRLRLVAAEDNLADVENRAMVEWLLRPECGDVRYVLRSYLHASEVWQDYDYVLLDCPARLTTACINAFAAADFVLIPVIPDQTSAEAVPVQLRALKSLQTMLCPCLEVLGLVANRTSPGEQLVQREQAIWDSLRHLCEDTWGQEVYQFRTLIRQKGSFAEAARANRFAAFYQDVERMFRDLARELVQRIAVHERQGR